MKRFLISMVLLLVPGMALSGGSDSVSQQGPDEEVNGYLVLLETDMRSADGISSGIEREAREGAFDKDGVRRSAYLTEQAISIAHARAQQLEQADGLTGEERESVRYAVKRLTDASASVGRLQSSIEIAPIVFRRQDEQNVRNEAIVLRAQLADARDAVDQVTNGYLVADRQETAR